MSFEKAKISNSITRLSIQSLTTKETDIDSQDIQETLEFTVKNLRIIENMNDPNFTHEHSQVFHQVENKEEKKKQFPLKSILKKKSRFQLNIKTSETTPSLKTKKQGGRMTLKQLEQSGIKCQQQPNQQECLAKLEQKQKKNEEKQQQYFSMEQIDFEAQFDLIMSQQIKIMNNTSEEKQNPKLN